jgi:hypothetical protein
MNTKPHSGEVVNLRMARKRKARKDADATASVHRLAFGLSKPEKKLAEARRDLAVREHEAHRIVPISGDA